MQTVEYEINKRIKSTKGQAKKHFLQFTDREEELIEEVIERLSHETLHISNHARAEFPLINDKIIRQVLNSNHVIEFNVTNGKPRLVLRSTQVLKTKVHESNVNGKSKSGFENRISICKSNVCLVIDISNRTVVTCWLNPVSDCHSTIHMDRYTEKINIEKYLTRFIGHGRMN